ncbi:hypothetical protein AB1Y20_014601 [Prymnesium parvum]|uniref:Major facilitator superfamily (MFS) profile domain-containing protein n=1 Tax=Prymnesium parvum TaxID=97485 RepID=A0AB34IDJ3_PRYPA
MEESAWKGLKRGRGRGGRRGRKAAALSDFNLEHDERAALLPRTPRRTAGDRDELPRARALLYIFLSLRFLESFAYFTLSNVFTLHLSSQFGLDDATAGTLFGLRGAVSHVYGTVLGPVVDAVGLRACLFVGFVLSALGRFWFACASTTQAVALAVYVPMAMGHSLVGCSLTIGIKRVTLPSPAAGSLSSSWGFAMAYCAAVCGIMLCGPMIDITTAVMSPAPPYQRLALITSALSCSAAVISAVALRCAPSSLIEPFVSMGPHQAASVAQRASGYCSDLTQVVCSRRFLRFCAFSVALLPGLTVLRNLDGGIFPKFMLRTFGPHVPKGTIYALNPLFALLLAPTLVSLLSKRAPWPVIRAGITISAVSPLVVSACGASLGSVVAFVLLLTLGDALYNPRMDAYAMSVAPVGREGTFAGAAAALVFLAEVPAGVLGGMLLERYCLDGHGCDARRLFGALAAFAALTPMALWSCPSLFREEASLEIAKVEGKVEGSSAARQEKWQLERELRRKLAAEGAAGIVGGGRPKAELVALSADQDTDDELEVE